MTLLEKAISNIQDAMRARDYIMKQMREFEEDLPKSISKGHKTRLQEIIQNIERYWL